MERTGMPQPKITVSARWNDAAGVWTATSGDIADLALSAHSFGELQERLPGVLRGLFARSKTAGLHNGEARKGETRARTGAQAGMQTGEQTGREGIPVLLRSRQIMTLPA